MSVWCVGRASAAGDKVTKASARAGRESGEAIPGRPAGRRWARTWGRRLSGRLATNSAATNSGHQLGRDQLWSAMGEKTKKIGRLEMDAGVEEDPKEDLKRLEVGVAVIKSQQLIHQHFT